MANSSYEPYCTLISRDKGGFSTIVSLASLNPHLLEGCHVVALPLYSQRNETVSKCDFSSRTCSLWFDACLFLVLCSQESLTREKLEEPRNHLPDANLPTPTLPQQRARGTVFELPGVGLPNVLKHSCHEGGCQKVQLGEKSPFCRSGIYLALYPSRTSRGGWAKYEQQ